MPIDLTNEDIKTWDSYRKRVPTKAIMVGFAFTVKTPEGLMTGESGDFLCEDVEGGRYPVKRTVFEKTYEKVR